MMKTKLSLFSKFPKPPIKVGHTLWMSDGQTLHTQKINRYPALVTHTFIGKDDRMYCVLEIEKEGADTYRLMPAIALSPTQDGPGFMSLLLGSPESPQPAKQFLYEAGFIDEEGALRPEYAGD